MKITAEISNIFTERSDMLRAAVNVILEDDTDRIIIKNVRVVDGERGLFMSLPARRNVKGEYKEICYPLSGELRKRMSEAVLSLYAAEMQNPHPDDLPPAA